MKRCIKALSLVLVVTILFSTLSVTGFAAALKIVAIKDLNASVYVNQSYSLPTTIDATMSDKTTQKVAVTWNPKTVDTSKTGTFVNKGTVKGYSKQVLLTIKVLPKPAPAQTDSDTKYIHLPYGVYDKVPADEINRAVFFGIVPKELQGNYKNQITFKEFCSLMRSMLNKYNPKTLIAWDKTAQLAIKSNKGMLRQDAYAPLFFAAQQMGVARKMGKDTEWDLYQKKTGEPWDAFLWNYPLFPIATQPTKYHACDTFNYTSAGYMLTISKRSWLSGNILYDYDEATNSMRVKDKLTREEAVKAVLRLAENTKYPILTGRQPKYVNVSNIGTYNKSIITDGLLNAPTKLPDASQSKLPMWRGAGNTQKSHWEDYRESDVRFLAENNYNFMRIMSDYASYALPDVPKDPEMVNPYEFEELDKVIAWGMEYGVHISILMAGIVERSRDNETTEYNNYPNTQEWGYIQDYWTALAKRYKGIPSKYVSFDIMNEWNPSNINKTEQFKNDWQKVITAIRAVDPDRLLLASFDKDVAAAEAIAELGVAVAAHPYYPYVISGIDWEMVKNIKYSLDPVWPMPYFPSLSFNKGEALINITGVESGGTLSIATGSTSSDAVIEVYGDSKLLQAVAINSPEPFDGELASVNIPAGFKTLTLKKTKGWLNLNCLIFESGSLKVNLLPHDFAFFLEEGGEVNLKISSNGTWENTDGKIIDANSVYEKRIKPFQEVAEKNGVGFMVDEFGPFVNCLPYDNNQVVKYAADLVGLMEQKQIPYSYCELILGNGYRSIISLDGSFVYRNADLQKLTYKYSDGMTDTFWYNKKLIDAMKAKMIK